MGNEPDNTTRQLATLDLSKLHRYSFGIAIEDNLDNESRIKIYPVEKLFSLGGDLNKEDKWIENKIKERKIDKTGEYDPNYIESLEDITLDRTRYIYADWIKSNNQITPPNICKGEYVVLYRYSNRDEYYWSVELTDLTLRKEEHVVYTFSDKPNLDENEDPLEDRYTVTFSPKNKEVKIHTTDKYGEYTTYDITIKTDDGYIEILDGKKNSIKLDSTQDMLHTHMEGTNITYDETIHGDAGYIETKDSKGNAIKLDSTKDMLHTHIKGSNITYDETIHGDDGYIETKDSKNNSIKLDSTKDMLHTHIKGSSITYDETIHGDSGYIETKDSKGNSIKLDSNKSNLTTNINNDIIENTKNETKNIQDTLKINLNKVAIKNNTTELISLLCEYIQDHIAEQHIGNLGIPTVLSGDSISKYQEVLQKMQSLKA